MVSGRLVEPHLHGLADADVEVTPVRGRESHECLPHASCGERDECAAPKSVLVDLPVAHRSDYCDCPLHSEQVVDVLLNHRGVGRVLVGVDRHLAVHVVFVKGKEVLFV